MSLQHVNTTTIQIYHYNTHTSLQYLMHHCNTLCITAIHMHYYSIHHWHSNTSQYTDITADSGIAIYACHTRAHAHTHCHTHTSVNHLVLSCSNTGQHSSGYGVKRSGSSLTLQHLQCTLVVEITVLHIHIYHCNIHTSLTHYRNHGQGALPLMPSLWPKSTTTFSSNIFSTNSKG